MSIAFITADVGGKPPLAGASVAGTPPFCGDTARLYKNSACSSHHLS
jgi:hypothetical protein